MSRSITEAEVSENLVNRILSGDDSAEHEMVAHYQPRLFKSLYSQSWDEDLARDIAQDTWVIALEKVRTDKLKNKTRLASFIKQIGSYQLIMRYRKNRKLELVDDEYIDSIVSDKGCPVEELSNSQTKQIVEQLLSEMKIQRDRELLAKFYLQGHSKQALCSEYRLSRAHFDRVLYRARGRVKKIWELKFGGPLFRQGSLI